MFKYGVANKVTFVDRGGSSGRICSSRECCVWWADTSALPFWESFVMHKILPFIWQWLVTKTVDLVSFSTFSLAWEMICLSDFQKFQPFVMAALSPMRKTGADLEICPNFWIWQLGRRFAYTLHIMRNGTPWMRLSYVVFKQLEYISNNFYE